MWARARQVTRQQRLLLWLACSLLAGCSTFSLAYNFADWILLWKIDGYFDISAEQEQFLEGRLTELHTWHRIETLPLYAAFLRRVQEQWRDGLTHDEIDGIVATYHELRADLIQRIVPHGALFLTTVDTEQIRHLEQALLKENLRLVNRVGGDPEERRARRIESTLDWLEDWLGSLTPEQEHRIIEWLGHVPDTTDQWLAYRRHRQEELVRLLQSQQHPTVVESQLRDWLATPEKGAPPDYAQSLDQMRKSLKALAWNIDRTLTPQQRTHAVQKLDQLIQELEGLAGG